MQFDEAARLRRAWEAKGNPSWDHPRVEAVPELLGVYRATATRRDIGIYRMARIGIADIPSMTDQWPRSEEQ